MTGFSRRAVLCAALLLIAIPTAARGATTEDTADPETIDIVFPVDGPHSEDFDNYGDCRGGDCSRTHEGADIMADKMTPVVAVADGFVTSVEGIDPVTGAPIEGDHQWLVLQHEGWQTRYLHLNNDTEGTDDGQGVGIAPDIVSDFVAAGGDGRDSGFSHPVSAGQLIGWVGDSGNAEWSGSHLHFELRIGDGWDAYPIDPYPALTTLQFSLDAPAAAPAIDYFADDNGSVHETDINTLAADGTTKGCNPPDNTMYCPQRLITRGEIAAFIRRTLDLPPADEDYFTDDGTSVFSGDIDAFTAAGIGFGCTETQFCPDEPLLRDEMAEMLVRAFADDHPDLYSNPEGTDFFVDDNGNRFEDSIDLLMAAGVTKGCNPPDNDRFCPDRPLIRAEMASFFVRALGR